MHYPAQRNQKPALAAALLGAALCPIAPLLAQSSPPGPPKSGPLPRPDPKPIRPLQGPGVPVTPLPSDTSIPGLEDADFKVHPAPLRSEGTFLLLKRGSMIRLPGGEKAFVFETDDKKKTERPMVLIPSQTLQRMEQLAADRPETEPAAFWITGQVFAYKSVNYLLPTAYKTVQPSTEETGSPPPANAEAPGAPPAKREPHQPVNADDPSVQDLIKALEAQRERPQTIEPDRTAPAAPAAGGTPESAAGAARVIPEGRTIMRRRARMVRTSSGQWAAAFDAGPKGEPGLDRPIPLAPCLLLQRMESQANSKGDAAILELSGQVLTYQGRNSLIPTSFRVYPPDDFAPRQ